MNRVLSYRCTGLTARWCPLHGTCQCRVPEPNGSGAMTWDDNMDHDDCPLHSMQSKHPRPGRIITRRRPWLEQ